MYERETWISKEGFCKDCGGRINSDANQNLVWCEKCNNTDRWRDER
ncbi:hypothetical protein IMZ31_22915 (plasmid) [Pontibacillus sp. ALD_SL1]|nr:hypothetical protein [Pontibacillus sp. ALD_SL1]QST02307.1 hypothetical protein IMZ31_22915 [Pontibacillus sp. ALD_SL1]